MGQDNAELIAEARSVLADMETRQEYDDCFARVVDALERVTPREVTTVAELEALPPDSIIRSVSGSAWRKDRRGLIVGDWRQTGPRAHSATDIGFPATVLFTPTGKKTE